MRINSYLFKIGDFEESTNIDTTRFLTGCFIRNEEVEEVRERLGGFFGNIEWANERDVEEHLEDYFVKKILTPFNETYPARKIIRYTKEEYVDRIKEQIFSGEISIEELIMEMYMKDFRDMSVIEILDFYHECIENESDEFYFEAAKIKDNGFYKFDEEGNAYQTFNKNERWFRCEVGGSTNNSLIDKNGKGSNIQSLKDIDFDKIAETKIEWATQRYNQSKEEPIYGFVYNIDNSETLDSYIDRVLKESNVFNLYAAIIDGEWYDKGRLGSFGVSYGNYTTAQEFEEFIMEYINKHIDTHSLLIVDCII